MKNVEAGLLWANRLLSIENGHSMMDAWCLLTFILLSQEKKKLLLDYLHQIFLH